MVVNTWSDLSPINRYFSHDEYMPQEPAGDFGAQCFPSLRILIKWVPLRVSGCLQSWPGVK
jgi:hypothetical protein